MDRVGSNKQVIPPVFGFCCRGQESDFEQAAIIAKLKQLLLDHPWYYHDNLFPPGGTCRFNADGTFHVFKWHYWVVGPRAMRVHYDRNTTDKDIETGILFTFNQELTIFTAEFTDPKGKVHKITGTRQ